MCVHSPVLADSTFGRCLCTELRYEGKISFALSHCSRYRLRCSGAMLCSRRTSAWEPVFGFVLFFSEGIPVTFWPPDESTTLVISHGRLLGTVAHLSKDDVVCVTCSKAPFLGWLSMVLTGAPICKAVSLFPHFQSSSTSFFFGSGPFLRSNDLKK